MKDYEIKVLGFRHAVAKDELFRRAIHTGDGIPAEHIMTSEFREMFAKSVAERIIKDWDNIVFGEGRVEQDGEIIRFASMYIGVKKEE